MKSLPLKLFVAGVFALLFTGCETIPTPPPQVITDFSQVAHQGKVYYKTHLPSSFGNPASTRFMIPVFIGGVLIPITSAPGFGPKTTAFYLYYIRQSGAGPLLSVAYPGVIPDSTCVDVLIHKDAVPKDSYIVGEAVLKPTEQCKQ
jgi:hypothetical protein